VFAVAEDRTRERARQAAVAERSRAEIRRDVDLLGTRVEHRAVDADEEHVVVAERADQPAGNRIEERVEAMVVGERSQRLRPHGGGHVTQRDLRDEKFRRDQQIVVNPPEVGRHEAGARDALGVEPGDRLRARRPLGVAKDDPLHCGRRRHGHDADHANELGGNLEVAHHASGWRMIS